MAGQQGDRLVKGFVRRREGQIILASAEAMPLFDHGIEPRDIRCRRDGGEAGRWNKGQATATLT
jgi:hypothetical protein